MILTKEDFQEMIDWTQEQIMLLIKMRKYFKEKRDEI